MAHLVHELPRVLTGYGDRLNRASQIAPTGLCGFDGFIDTFIRMESPAGLAVNSPIACIKPPLHPAQSARLNSKW